MKHILKSITLLLCLCMVLSLVACDGNQPAGESSTPSTQETSDTQAVQDGPNENQCAGDITATTEETDYPTEESVTEATEFEAPVEEETTESVPGEDEPLPEEEEDPGDIQLPLDEIVE